MIKLTMPGEIFFMQSRIGLNRKSFRLIKFRTMRALPSASEGRFDAGDTSRITKFGSFLRKFKLDELPQLINVLSGDMSIVGPRPEIKQWTECYSEKWDIVLSVRPGITDNASIMFRNEEVILAESANPVEKYKNEILPRKLDLYIDYVKSNSFSGDIKIIFETLKTIISK